jgi:hypothetical protein
VLRLRFVECCVCLEQAGRRRSCRTGDDQNVYLVVDDFGPNGRAYRETDVEDASADIAPELRRRCDLQVRDVPSGIQDFVDSHAGPDRQLALRLARP